VEWVKLSLAGYGDWGLTLINVTFFAAFLLFLPFRKRIRSRSSSIYLAFLVALYAEMYGFPLTIYILTYLFGYSNPLTHQAGHLLPFIDHGTLGHLLTEALIWIGIALVVLGWWQIHGTSNDRSLYWKLVTDGIYGIVRHPQYLGFLLLTLGMLIQWITIPTALMWPILVVTYHRLAKEEEKEMEKHFGKKYEVYRSRVPMFIPFSKILSRGLSRDSLRRKVNKSESNISY
jgi:protein-S-isoprenylcysteine O-methyltransferase Ste14